MANKRIHDLAAAGSVADAMQLETDTSGTQAQKITALQLRNYIRDTLTSLASGITVSGQLSGQTLKLTLEPLTVPDPATYVGYNFSIFDNKSSFINNNGGMLGGFEFVATADGVAFTQVLDIDGAGNAELKGALRAPAPMVNVTSTSRTLSFSFLGGGDQNACLHCSNAGTQTLTVPPNSTHAFPVGTEVYVVQEGAGQVVFAAGSGVTINSPSSFLKISRRYGRAQLKKTATNTWVLTGELAA